MQKDINEYFDVFAEDEEDLDHAFDPELNFDATDYSTAVGEILTTVLHHINLTFVPHIVVAEGICDELFNYLGIIVGYHGKGLLGKVHLRDNFSPDETDSILGIQFCGKFDLDQVLLPSTPFVQIRFVELQNDILVLGEVSSTSSDVDHVNRVLFKGLSCQNIAHK